MPKITPNDIKNSDSKKKFLERCVPITLHEGTTKDPKQAYAICISRLEQYEKKHKERKHKAKGSIVIANEVNKEVMNEAAKAALEYYKNNKKTK